MLDAMNLFAQGNGLLRERNRLRVLRRFVKRLDFPMKLLEFGGRIVRRITPSSCQEKNQREQKKYFGKVFHNYSHVRRGTTKHPSTIILKLRPPGTTPLFRRALIPIALCCATHARRIINLHLQFAHALLEER